MTRKWPGNAKRSKTTFGGLSRSSLMSRIHGRDNKTTELRMLGLLKQGNVTGWRRHVALYGKPDFTWPKQRVVLFVDGCFWHGHTCNRNLVPRRNARVWKQKMDDNRSHDRRVNRRLRISGWTVVRIWECQLKENPIPSLLKVVNALKKSVNVC